MKVAIDLRKSLQQNADFYYELSKKSKKKLAGLENAIKKMKEKISEQQSKAAKQKKGEIAKKRRRRWYEQFHWFRSSDGFLVIAGRDAKSNEVVVKRHMDETDSYFHADIHGAPHTIVKSEGKNVPDATMKEAAIFAAVFSKAWQQGLASADVYSVKPGQVSKKTKSGESMPAGAYMIYGERRWFRKTPLDFALGVKKEEGSYIIVSGPPSAIKKNSEFFFELKGGKMKKSEAAKKLKALIENKLERKAKIDLDELMAMLPAGNFDIKV